MYQDLEQLLNDTEQIISNQSVSFKEALSYVSKVAVAPEIQELINYLSGNSEIYYTTTTRV